MLRFLGTLCLMLAGLAMGLILLSFGSSAKDAATLIFVLVVVLGPFSVFMAIVGGILLSFASVGDEKQLAKEALLTIETFSQTDEPVVIEARWADRGETIEAEAGRVVSALVALAELSPILANWTWEGLSEGSVSKVLPSQTGILALLDKAIARERSDEDGPFVEGRLGQQSLVDATVSFRFGAVGEVGDRIDVNFFRLSIAGGTDEIPIYDFIRGIVARAFQPMSLNVSPPDLSRRLSDLPKPATDGFHRLARRLPSGPMAKDTTSLPGTP